MHSVSFFTTKIHYYHVNSISLLIEKHFKRIQQRSRLAVFGEVGLIKLIVKSAPGTESRLMYIFELDIFLKENVCFLYW